MLLSEGSPWFHQSCCISLARKSCFWNGLQGSLYLLVFVCKGRINTMTTLVWTLQLSDSVRAAIKVVTHPTSLKEPNTQVVIWRYHQILSSLHTCKLTQQHSLTCFYICYYVLWLLGTKHHAGILKSSLSSSKLFCYKVSGSRICDKYTFTPPLEQEEKQPQLAYH